MPEKPIADLDPTSYWVASAPLPVFAPLDRDTRADVVVVGGGITGLTAAFLLATSGKSVVVLERDRLAHVDTGQTTAHLTMVTDTRLSELVTRVGRTHAQAAWDAGLAAIAQIESIVWEQGIDCGFSRVDGYLHAPRDAPGEETSDSFAEEASLAHDMGFDAEFVSEVPLMGTPGIRFEHQARVHPRRYLAGLVDAITRAGGRIFEHSAADEFHTDPLSISVNGRTLACDDLVVATHNPVAGITSTARAMSFQTKLALYTSYVVAGRVARGRIPDALFWDTRDPYAYLRLDPHPDHDLVVFGGADHKTGQAPDTREHYARLEEELRRLIPDVSIDYRWSGQVIETPDGLPYIGRMADHQFTATGFAGNGMTFGTLGAMMATDQILGQANPWIDLFDPDRTAIVRGAWEYLRENADYPYYLIRGRFAGAETRSLRAVKAGEGTVVQHDGRKIAAYRDEAGTLTLRSAICPHLGCVVQWNTAERTWDCPCHGSRFTVQGDVISGPAESPLADEKA